MAFASKAALLADLNAKWQKVGTEVLEETFEGVNRYSISVFGIEGASLRWRTVGFYEDVGTGLSDYEIQQTVKEEVYSYISTQMGLGNILTGEIVTFNEEALTGVVRVAIDNAGATEFSFYYVYKDDGGVWQKEVLTDAQAKKALGIL